ncbi:phage major capsid protein [Lachnospiraceae bacterium OF11-28]|jgi:HK97 family phage major capsid protein|uniref:Major capsid protein n=1 Tax=Siphoviridae sp. ct1TR2 TaxID=2825309 RepID=A0A8S5NSC3_9CAUD|nr:phage major capsid protein [Lachnospiraceae bacterium OF11-28]DAD97630.1 MAG TPA: major capsid protein [Siphoviridae sp. ct1TR2]DAN05245.1 MAG TPA: major capsid protein [Caudoviricetes sp.]
MNEKELREKRDQIVEQMQAITDNATNVEKRTLTTEEQQKFAGLKKEVEDIDATLEAMEQSRTLLPPVKTPEKKEPVEDIEIRTFANIIRNRVDANITKTANGAVIPTTIAKKIIDVAKDRSPLFKDAEKYNIRGTVSIPYVDTDNDNITVAYATEFTELEAKDTKLLTVDLKGFLAGALCKVSRSLLNSTDLDLTTFVVNKMGAALADFLDKQIIQGDSTHITGLSTATQIVTAKAATAITADELITLKNKLKSVFQAGAYWVMAPDTLTAVQQLKDENGRYLFNDEIKNGFSGTILGKPVYTSDQCPGMAATKTAIFYISPKQALAAKIVEDSVQILNEKYATQHAIGVVEWAEVDCKIQNQQAVAVLKMAAS